MKRLFTSVVLTALAAPSWAVDYRVMVSRVDDAVELFIEIPAPLLPEMIGSFPDGTIDAAGTIDISPFRRGTADHGDAIFQNVTADFPGADATFEAMSMMVHPLDYDLEFRDPIDAMVAISVCNVPADFTRFEVANLKAYLGYIAYPVDGYGELEIDFPKTAEVEVIEYVDGRKVDARNVALTQHGVLNLPAPPRRWSWLPWRS